MNLPASYDAWRTASPYDDEGDPCVECDDTQERECPECGNPPEDSHGCIECDGTGFVTCDCEQFARDHFEAAQARRDDEADHRYELRREGW
jgi:hypothetical protein